MNITEKELINQLSEEYGYTKKSAKMLIRDFEGIILLNMRRGNTVSLRDFGIFDLVYRNDHGFKDALTGERKIIKGHWMPKFYPSISMKRNVKIWESEQEDEEHNGERFTDFESDEEEEIR